MIKPTHPVTPLRNLVFPLMTTKVHLVKVMRMNHPEVMCVAQRGVKKAVGATQVIFAHRCLKLTRVWGIFFELAS